GEWFHFRGCEGIAADLLARAERGGAAVSHLVLGRCLWLSGDPGGAAAEYAKAAASKEAPEAYLKLCAEAARTEAEIAEATAALAKDPKDAGALAARGAAHFKKGAIRKAFEDFDKALDLDPAAGAGGPRKLSVLYAQRGRERLMSDRDVAGALSDAARALALDAGNRAAVFVRGAARSFSGDLEKGLADLDAFLEAEPRHLEGLLARAMARFRAGRPDDAVGDATKAIETDPGFADAWAVRGQIRRMAKRHAEAVADFKEYLRLIPNVSNREEIEAYIQSQEGK
ncbi:MAG: tetratricopeptide repeat protein, partial [Planctomycetes bacterium]|nr:tetratricopeptide repeat protein [Planctomycetota bacterium]